MAAYQTQQINVGSIAAPDVGSVFSNFADRLQKQQAFEIDKARQMRLDDRQQVLNQRADQAWNRQQKVLEAEKDIAKKLIDAPYSAEFGGSEAMAKADEAVIKEAQRRMDAGEAPFNAEEAAGIQKTYEANRPYMEDAHRNIAARLMALGATAQEADAEAKGLTGGLISRANEQAYLDQNRKVLQEQYDNVAKANLEALKANIDIGKANQSGDVHKAEIQQKAMQIMYGGGTGGSGGKDSDGVSGSGYSGISNVLGTIGWSDAAKAQDAISKYVAKGYTDRQIQKALSESIDIDPSAKFISDRNVNFDAMDRRLAEMTPGQNPYTNTTSIRDVNTGGINAADLMAKIAPYQRAGYNPDRMEALLRSNVPSIFKGEAVTNTGGVSAPQSSSTESTSSKSTTGGNTLADRNNNPGNLRINAKNDWQGGRDGEKGFVKFDTPELGARALAKTINNNVGMTVKGFINKYAPPGENDTNSYIDQVSKKLGKDSSATISKDDIPELMKVIAKREGGSFTNDQLMGGYKLFLNETTKGATSGLPEVTSIDKSYDRLSSIIEPTLGKNTKIETQEQKQELINKYEPIIQKVEDNFKRNHGGPIDDQVAVSKLMMELKIPKNQAIRMYQEITDPLQPKTQIDNYYNQFGGVGVKTQAQQDEINSKISNEPPMTIMDIIDGYNKFPGTTPWIMNKVANGVLNGIKSFEDQDSTDRLVQKLRASTLAEKYKSNPASLTTNERNWILQSKTTPNGRKQLQELGIE